MLQSLMRKLLSRPKRSDPRPLAQFYYTDEELARVTAELNCVDIRKDPQQYLVLLNRLRSSQERMLRIIEQIVEDCIPNERESRDYLVKFPDEILQENLGVQLLFAAECLSAGSFLVVHDSEAVALQPQAARLLRTLGTVRSLLRAQSLSDPGEYSRQIRCALLQFDKAFADFELSYISSVISVKSPEELYKQQEIVVLFCETVARALKLGYLTQDMIEGYEPQLMFAIPRLAIVCGLLIYPEGPLNLQQSPEEMSKLFSPFFSVLRKIRDLLYVLTEEELYILEKNLCSAESENGFFLQASSPNSIASASITTAHLSPGEGAQSVSGSSVQHKQQEPQQDKCSAEQLACIASVTETYHMPSHTADSTSTLECNTSVPSEGNLLVKGSVPNCNGNNEQERMSQSHDLDTSACFRNPEDQNHSDLELIKRAVQIARQVAREEIRSRYRSSSDMIHRLFVCISGVADQLQTNFASDLRSILKTVFETISSKPKCLQNDEEEEEEEEECREAGNECVPGLGMRLEDCTLCQERYTEASGTGSFNNSRLEDLPEWIPDSASSRCMACKATFTLVRRRHHCRNCGKIFCSHCSRHMALLPRYGLMKPVRVCNHCYTFHVAPHPEEASRL